MATPADPLPHVRLPAPAAAARSPEQLYWKSFKTPLLLASPSNSPVTVVSQPATPNFATSTPDIFAVVTGARLQLYSIRTRKLVRTITRFDETARAADIRPDGRVVVAADDSGTVQVFDTTSRSILRTWKGIHRQPVWAARFAPADPTTLLTGSDDRSVRLWDLASGMPTRTWAGHGDYVRAAAFMPGGGGIGGSGGSASSNSLLVTGSYDQTVRLWDARAPDSARAALTFKLAAPVEAILPLAPVNSSSAATTVLAAADTSVAVLDVVAGRPLNVLRNHHQRAVTALAPASGGRRVVTGALDGHAKVLEAETGSWRVVAGAKYSAPILSLAVIRPPGIFAAAGDGAQDRHLVAGLESGLISIKTRLSGEQRVVARAREREMAALAAGTIEAYDARQAKKVRKEGGNRYDKIKQTASYRRRVRGMDFDPDAIHVGANTTSDPLLQAAAESIDLVIDPQVTPASARKKRRGWQEDLHRARYADALAAVTANPGVDPLATVTCLAALRHRAALKTAVAGLVEAARGVPSPSSSSSSSSSTGVAPLFPLLRWSYRSIADPRTVSLAVEVAAAALEVYAETVARAAAEADVGVGAGFGVGGSRSGYQQGKSKGKSKKRKGGPGDAASGGDGDDDDDDIGGAAGAKASLKNNNNINNNKDYDYDDDRGFGAWSGGKGDPDAAVDKLVGRLRTRVREEVGRAQQAWVTRGMLELMG